MRFNRVLHSLLALALISGPLGGCSEDSSQEETSHNIPILNELYAAVQAVELDYSRGYLLRNATSVDREQFELILQDIKIASMRLQKNPGDSQALLQLSIASEEYDKLNILEIDQNQLEALDNKLKEALEVIARGQNKTLENIDRVLFKKTFELNISPFTVVTAGGNKNGWVKSYHQDITFARVPASNSGANLDSWMLSPRFDLSNVRDPSFALRQAISNSGYPYDKSVSFLVSEDYEGGDPSLATWVKMSPARLPAGNGFTTVDSENISLKAFEGKKIVVAMRYNTTTSGDSRIIWQLNRFELMGSGTVESSSLEGLAVAPTLGGGGSSNGNEHAACAGSKKAIFGIEKPNEPAIFSGLFPHRGQNPVPAAVVDAQGKSYVPSPVTGFGGEKYPNIAIRFSGYRAEGGNIIGETVLASNPIEIASADGLCLGLSEILYDGNGSIDAKDFEIVYSTAFSGDVKTTAWKVADFGKRYITRGTPKPQDQATRSYSVPLSDVKVGDKVAVGFRYRSSAAAAPWWGIESLKLNVKGTGSAPATNPATPSLSLNAPAVTGPCAVNNAQHFSIKDVKDPANLSELFPKNLQIQDPAPTPVLDANGTVSDARLILSGYADKDKYPNIALRLSNYRAPIRVPGATPTPNLIVADSWVVSKPIALSNIENLCMTLSEVIYDGNGTIDLNNLQVLYATDFSGDIKTAQWTTVDFGARTITKGTVKANAPSPLNTYGVQLPSIALNSNVVIALRYKGGDTVSPWWGINNLSLSYKDANAAPAPRAETRPAAPERAAPEIVPPPPVTGVCAANDKVLFAVEKPNEPANLALETGLLPVQIQNAEPAVVASAGDQRLMLGRFSEKYPNIAVRFSSFRSAKDASGATVPNNIVGESWVVSKAIPVDSAENLCLTLTEAIFDGRGPLDLNQLQVVYATDFNGDVAAAKWTVLPLEGRTFSNGTVKSNASIPTKAYGVPLSGVEAGKMLHIGLRFKGTAESAPWWGIETLKVTAKNP